MDLVHKYYQNITKCIHLDCPGACTKCRHTSGGGDGTCCACGKKQELKCPICLDVKVEENLEIFKASIKSKKIAYKKNIAYDKRTKMEVVEDLLDSGMEVYPSLYPFTLIETGGFDTQEGKLFPLGGISKVTTVYCNESGNWIVYESNEHGFNNPKKLYNAKDVEIIIVGDSFAKGSCVEVNKNVGAILRNSGLKTISLSGEGNGPLAQLATLKEYGKHLEPLIVLWFFYPNDIIVKYYFCSFLNTLFY